jgi:hypothetical protein
MKEFQDIVSKSPNGLGNTKAFNQYSKHNCNMNSLPDPKHYAAVFTNFHAKGKANNTLASRSMWAATMLYKG